MKDRLRKKKRDEAQEIASERMEILFSLAEKKAVAGEMEAANLLVERACRIGTKFNVRVPKAYKYRFCRKCHSYLLPGKSSRTRINSKEKRVEVLCVKCGHKAFHPYVAEVKDRRRRKLDSKTKNG